VKLKYGPYSPSRLDTARCPYSFFRQYVDPDRSKTHPESVPQARGSAVHEVFEQITNYHKAGQSKGINMDDIRTWTSKAIQRHPAAYEDTGAILEMARLYVERPPKVLTSDAEVELRMGVKMTDTGFEECSYDDPGAIARGRADIMMVSDDMTEALVYDHKTQPNIEDADTFQMSFYAWVISKTHPFLQKITTILHFARYGSYRSYEWTREDLAAVEGEILTKIQTIEGTESWTAIPHEKCLYCPFKTSCPTFAEIIKFDDNGKPSVARFMTLAEGGMPQAVKTAGFITLLEEALENLKKELKTYVSLTSPVAIPGRIYEFRAKEGIDWDKVNKKFRKQVYEVFDECGIDPKEYMGFSQTLSKEILQSENEKLCKKLGELLPRKTTTEFRGYKL